MCANQGTTMNLDNPNGTEPTVSAKTKVRRTFLKRASAGAVLTSLPAHSVWGAVCSVSGAMSGNLSGIQRHSNCEMPALPAGRSPGTWKNLVLLKSSKVHAVFNGLPNPSGKINGVSYSNADDLRLHYMNGVKAVAESHEMKINHSLIDSSFRTNLYDSLTHPGGIDYEMAAVWLNAYFGLGGKTPYESAATADQIVEQLLSYLLVQERAGTLPSFTDDFFNFVDGSTDYKFVGSPELEEASDTEEDEDGKDKKDKKDK